jgi:hypothetical protein
MPPPGSSDRDLLASKPSTLVAVLETVAAAAAVLAVGHWLRPGAPFLIHEPFSWPALAPLLIGLRYGFAYGFGCALMLVVALAASWRFHWLGVTQFPSQFGVGLLVVGMVAGEFADVWMRRVRRLGVMADFRRQRLDEFARAYHLLKVSHDTLEQRVVGSSQNLREAMQTMRRQLLVARDPNLPLRGLENAIMQLFAGYGFIQSAALFVFDEEQRIVKSPVATMGVTLRIVANDPLLAEAVQRRTMISIRPGVPVDERSTELLAAIPICDVGERMWAVLAVRHMLFVAYHADNLKLLAVLGGHTGDILAYGEGWSSVDDQTIEGFRRHLRRAVEDRRSLDLPSALISLMFGPGEQASTIVDQVIGQRRGLDQALVVRPPGGLPRVFLLLAVTDELGAQGYLSRLRRSVHERYGTDLAAAGVEAVLRVIDKRDRAEDLLREIARRAELPAESLLG